MADINVGDRVRIKERKDWPSPPGYIMANAEGTVVKWAEYEEITNDFQDYFHIKLDKAEGAAKIYVGHTFPFQVENLEKMVPLWRSILNIKKRRGKCEKKRQDPIARK